jgi:lipopolysaccharide export system protein LptA
MSPFIPPDNPPALIQSVNPEDINDRTDSSKFLKKIVKSKHDRARNQKISFNLASKLDSVLLAPLPLTPPERSQPQPKKATPEVVEFYNGDPKKIDVPSLPKPEAIESTAEGAQSLGRSISVGGEVVKEPKPILQSAQAIKGLSQINLRQELQGTKLLVTKQRGGAVREFQMSPTTSRTDAIAQQQTAPQQQPTQEQPTSVVEVIADRQEYDSQRRVITATGNVEIRFPNGVLVADRVQVNVSDRVAVAVGDVVLTRGEQILRGNRFEYYFVQDSGVILQANGEIYQPSVGRDFSPTLPTDTGTDAIPNQTLSDRLALNQPLQRVTTAGGYSFVVGGGDEPDIVGRENENLPETTIGGGGRVNRVRFQAERIDFDAEQWTATNVRLTNDPFSPPELELRAERATYRNIAPLVDEVTLSDSRIVFDQSVSIPTFQDRILIDRRPRQPGLFSIAYDGRDRGGLYIERGFNIIDTQNVNFQIKPQYLIQRAFFPGSVDSDDEDNDGGIFDLSSFGLVADLDVNFGVRTDFQATTSFSSLDVDNISDNLRANVQLRQKIGALSRPHDLRLEYNYRERLFNGSLGFRTVESSIGAILVSPTIALGNTGINLSYQASVQHIEAETDRPELLEPEREDNLIDLTRYQGAASISKGFTIWQGEALPPTAEEGLRYTPTPVQPFLQLSAGLTGVASFYSNGDSQPSLIASVGLLGQFGNFSRPFFDYTGFNISYSQGIRGDESPFLFDRFADTQTLSFGITQQIYGPIRVGVQSSLSLNNNEEISTDYFIEFSRRTYNILLRYNPVLEVGSINLRISDFNWSGNPGSLEGTDIRPVIRGVTR